MSHEPSPNSRAGNLSLLASHLLQRSAPQYLMVVLLLAVFTVNPSSLMMNGPSKPHHGRSLNSLDTALDSDWTIFWGLWLLRAALMLLAFGWLTLSATPSHVSGSKQVVSYWRLRKQAERDMQNVSGCNNASHWLLVCLHRGSSLVLKSVWRKAWM